MNISFFGDTPDEVINQLRLKKPELHFDYDEIRFNAHQKAFTVAKITKLDLLSDIQKSLEIALKNGESFKEWKKKIKPTLIKKGWWGDEVKVKNPKTGEEKTIKVGDRQLKTIFNTNIKTAYAMANYESGIASGAKYLRYTAVLDHRTRQNHADMHGIIKPINDKFWEKNYPPNGWNCRCSVMFLSEDGLKTRGWEDKVNTAILPNIADPDWAYHVGKNTSNVMKIYKDKIANLKGKISDEFIEFAKKEFLTTLKERVENLGIWGAIKDFFKTKPNLSEARVKIANVSPQLKTAFNNENLSEIYLSQQTISSHKHHTNITAWDYFILKKLLKTSKYFRDSTNKNSKILYLKNGNDYYRIVIKQTANNEIYMTSNVKGSSAKYEFEKFLKKGALHEL